MGELPWPTGPEHEPHPQPEAESQVRTPEMSLRWVPREVLDSSHAGQRKSGKHRAADEQTPPKQAAEVTIDPAVENKEVEKAWDRGDAEYLYLIWLGPKGKMLDEQFPYWEFRQMARDRLKLIGETKRVEAIERALRNPAPVVGRVSLREVQLKPALTEPIGEYPAVKRPNQL